MKYSTELKRWLRGKSRRLSVILSVSMLVLALIFLWVGGFGFPYLLKTPQALADVAEGDLPGSYVTVPVPDLAATFCYLGYQDAEGNSVASERYCLYLVGEKYLIVRVTEDDIPLLERYDSAEELVTSGQVGSLLEVNFGKLTGTVNDTLLDEVHELLKSWLTSHHIDTATMTDTLNEADLSAYAGADSGDYTGYFDHVILPYVLECGYLGVKPAGTVNATAILALIFLLLTVLLLLSLPLGLWEKAARKAAANFGWDALGEDFGEAQRFGDVLAVGKRYLWIRDRQLPCFLQAPDVIWAYPRSKRLEGGKKQWSLVLKTVDGREEPVLLREEALVEQAVAALAALGNPLCLGYDSEKQKLYENDLPGFVGRVRNGKL